MKEKDDNYSNKLGDPIFLDYDVNELKPIIKVSHAEMVGKIKEYFEKDGFERTGETYKGFTIFENVKKRNEKILNELFKKRSDLNE